MVFTLLHFFQSWYRTHPVNYGQLHSNPCIRERGLPTITAHEVLNNQCTYSTLIMAALKNTARTLLSPLRHQPWPLSTAIAKRIDINKLIEEEKSPYYNNPARFYPAHIGDVLDNRYQIAGKLGSGSNSTVWLARDLNRFV